MKATLAWTPIRTLVHHGGQHGGQRQRRDAGQPSLVHGERAMCLRMQATRVWPNAKRRRASRRIGVAKVPEQAPGAGQGHSDGGMLDELEHVKADPGQGRAPVSG